MQPYERIKHLRKNLLKLSQAAFANKINISRSNLGNIETDKVRLTDRVINDICNTYSVNKDWILNGNGQVFSENNDPFVSEIVELYQTLSDNNRRYLRGYVCRLLEEQGSIDVLHKICVKNKNNSVLTNEFANENIVDLNNLDAADKRLIQHAILESRNKKHLSDKEKNNSSEFAQVASQIPPDSLTQKRGTIN